MKGPKNLVLASGSPRRAEILRAVGWEFTKDVSDIDEAEIDGESPADYVCRLARSKAETISAKHKGSVVIGADTIVVIDSKIIGKPTDLDDARRMLNLLSGKQHEVLTAVAIVGTDKTYAGLQKTRVKFVKMSSAEIEFLVTKGEPLDKAGAYAVQAQAALFIEYIDGDYWNVVGLPINLVYRLMKDSAIIG